MKHLVSLLLSAPLAFGCGSSHKDHPRNDAGALPEDSGPPDAPLPAVTIRAGDNFVAAADPKLEGFTGWPLAFEVYAEGRGPVTCHISIISGSSEIYATDVPVEDELCEISWDARDVEEQSVRPGELTAIVTVNAGEEGLASFEAPLEVVRLGIDEITLDEVAINQRPPLMYGEMSGVAYGYYIIPQNQPVWRMTPRATESTDAVSMELQDGTPRTPPSIWASLKSPPLDATSTDGAEHNSYSLPSGWIAGSAMTARVHMTADIAGGRGQGQGAPSRTRIRVIPPEGLQAATGSSLDFVHNGELNLTTTRSMTPAVGRYDQQWRWTFEVGSGERWTLLPGYVETSHRFYGFAAWPILESESLPPAAWVEVVDAVTQWVDKTANAGEDTVVASKIVEGTYYSLGLVYDRNSGASAYTDYAGREAFDGATFDLVRFLRRSRGNVINCSDAASIVGTFANMIGVDLRYHILRNDDRGFDLNFIRAIGTADFSETPFTSGRGGFSYHAVVGPEDGTIYDGTLALDGDGTPTAMPARELLPRAMPPEQYYEALSSEWESIASTFNDRVSAQ